MIAKLVAVKFIGKNLLPLVAVQRRCYLVNNLSRSSLCTLAHRAGVNEACMVQLAKHVVHPLSAERRVFISAHPAGNQLGLSNT